MDYYHNLITEKSWQYLQTLKRHYNFILIGGWAVYLYGKALKSKDIDIICDYEELQKLKANFNLYKNDRLKKCEIHQGEFDVDIYLPFFSDLGLPVEEIQKKVRNIEGFLVPELEILLILKQKAWEDRKNSLKGEKDKIDIVALVKAGIDFDYYKKLLKEYNFTNYQSALKILLHEIREIPELDMNKHVYSKFYKKLPL